MEGSDSDLPAAARPGVLAILAAVLRTLLGWATLLYGILFLVLLFALEWVGEKFWPFGLLLYAPPYAVLLPLLILTPLALLFHRRLILWHAAFVAVLFFGYLTFSWTPEPPRPEHSLTAITFNCGDSDPRQFNAFVAAENPDIILLQDARGLGPGYAARFPGYSIVSQDEFILLSRFPIQKSALVPGIVTKYGPVAARFELLVRGTPLVIYNVRMPTPRRELSRFFPNRRLARELTHPGKLDPEFERYRTWLEKRIRLAESLAKVFAEEKANFLVGGDFNTPDHGYIHRLFASEMTDAFVQAGRGWGFTFPAKNPTRFARLGPWLRIDYFFIGRGWRATICHPEPGRNSEHKAVLARFEPL